MELYKNDACDIKHLDSIKKLISTLSDDKKIYSADIEKFKRFNIKTVMRIKINNFTDKLNNLERSIRIFKSKVSTVYCSDNVFVKRVGLL